MNTYTIPAKILINMAKAANKQTIFITLLFIYVHLTLIISYFYLFLNTFLLGLKTISSFSENVCFLLSPPIILFVVVLFF